MNGTGLPLMGCASVVCTGARCARMLFGKGK